MIKVINENSTALVALTFKDTDGVTFSPVTSYYQLMKPDGTIINNRTFDLNSFSGTEIVLSANDLAIDDNGDTERILGIKGTYDSDIGSGLPFTEEVRFNIRNLYSQY